MKPSKRKIAIIGAGQSGLQLAIHLLQQKNYDVSLFNDRTAEQIQRGRIMSSQVLFHTATQREKMLGLNFWDNQCTHNTSVTFSLSQAIHWVGYVDPYQSIDQRLKLPRWMEKFEELDGDLIVRNIDLNALDQIANDHELTIVATGKREFSQLFLRNDNRSRFNAPQRALACLAVKNMLPSHTAPGTHFIVIPNVGEYFTTPGLTHHGDCEMMVFEGIPGGPFDSWDTITSAETFLDHAKTLLRLFIPSEAGRCSAIQLADDNAFLAGRFTPTVRHSTYISNCGKSILGLGDTVVLNDPIAAQGANHACKSAFLYGEAIIKQGNKPFDEKWMREVAELSWNTYGRPACELSELFLMPLRESDLGFFKSAKENKRLANQIANGLDDPASMLELLNSVIA